MASPWSPATTSSTTIAPRGPPPLPTGPRRLPWAPMHPPLASQRPWQPAPPEGGSSAGPGAGGRGSEVQLQQLLEVRAAPPPQLTFADLHARRGTPAAAQAALAAVRDSAPWYTVASEFRVADRSARLADSISDWRSYVRTCESDGVNPLPITLVSILAWWHHRVIGQSLKSSALQSATSRVLSHAAALGSAAPQALAKAIGAELVRFRTAFPCEVSSAAPPLGDAGDGRLSSAIAYAGARAERSLFFRVLHTRLLVAQELYSRSSALLDGHLRRRDILTVPASPLAPGGLVLRLILPKCNKTKVDMRRDSFPIPTGPATRALLSLLSAPGIGESGADAAVFPDVCPVTHKVRGPVLKVPRCNDLLRKYVFVPAGILGGELCTLRSIRSGASTDAAAEGVSDDERIAHGGWSSAAGASPYLDPCIAKLAGRLRQAT